MAGYRSEKSTLRREAAPCARGGGPLGSRVVRSRWAQVWPWPLTPPTSVKSRGTQYCRGRFLRRHNGQIDAEDSSLSPSERRDRSLGQMGGHFTARLSCEPDGAHARRQKMRRLSALSFVQDGWFFCAVTSQVPSGSCSAGSCHSSKGGQHHTQRTLDEWIASTEALCPAVGALKCHWKVGSLSGHSVPKPFWGRSAVANWPLHVIEIDVNNSLRRVVAPRPRFSSPAGNCWTG
jgi:hypothetical protein